MSSRQGGVSLTEVLVGMVFLALFTVLVHQFCTALLHGVRVLEVASEVQESVRLGVQLIAADVREAGFAPAGPLRDGIRRASRIAVAIARDLNGDGDVDDAQERVAYQYAAERHALMRAQGDAPAQPLLDGLDDDGVELTYVAADGTRLDPGSGELDAAARARIRRIGVRVRVALPNPNPLSHVPLRCEEQAAVALRNAEH